MGRPTYLFKVENAASPGLRRTIRCAQ